VDQLTTPFSHRVISTDGVRAAAEKPPLYGGRDGRVYELCYALIERRLEAGQRVVFDASNYLAARRQHVIQLAENCGAAVAIATIQAAQEVVRQRLQQRMSSSAVKGICLTPTGRCTNGWSKPRNRLLIPTLFWIQPATPPDELAAQLAHYWLQVEERAPGNLNLQSPRWANQFSRND
jgi:hypothetical protein